MSSLCASCGLHPGTRKWVGEGGSLAMNHGFYEMRCEGCVLRAQIAFAEERAAALDELRLRLAEWETTHEG